MRTALTAFLLTGVVLTLHGSAAQRDGTVAFTNVSVVPMDCERILSDQTVIVSADRIMASDTPMLTLVTCYPFSFIGRAPQRFIVRAERL